MSNPIIPETLPIVWPDSPRTRRNHPASSHEAADATAPIVAASQAAIAALFENENHPMTAVEVERKARFEYGLPYSESRIRSTLPELETLGVLVRDGFVRRDGDKRRRQLWTLKAAA